MEIRTLRYFLAIVKEKNMTRAAARLHLSQPALSRQLKRLEEELGKTLFLRHSTSLELTSEGKLLAKRAEDLIALNDKILDEFNALEEEITGDLYFGLAESYQIRMLAREIKIFKERYPKVMYHITSGDTDQVLEKLDQGVIDFTVLVGKPDENTYHSIPFREGDRWGLVVREDSPLAEKKEIVFEDLIGRPLFCSEQSWREDIPRWCGKRIEELHLEGSFRLSYNASVFVREGLGDYLTLEHLLDTSDESGLVFRPLKPRLESKLYFVWRRDQVQTPVTERFLEQVRESFVSF